MNPEIIKAMNRKNEKHSIRDWWEKNDYKVMRVVLFPIWIPMWAVDKIQKKMYACVEWDEERLNEVLDYYVPRKCSWNEEQQELYFFDNGYGWSISLAKRYLKFKDRCFWKKFSIWNGGNIRQYLLFQFELEGFTKKLGNCSDGWTEIYFKKIEEGT